MNPLRDTSPTVSRAGLLSHAHLDVTAEEFLHDKNTIFSSKPSVNFRNYVDYRVDVQPVKDPRYTEKTKFLYGQENVGLLVGMELWANLPTLDTTNGTYAEYKPYIAELLLGTDEDTLRHMYNTNILREDRLTGRHFKRRLQQNAYDGERAQYNNAVRAVSTGTAAGGWVHTYLQIPHCRDAPVVLDQAVPAYAFSQEHSMEFRVPSILDLVHTDVPAADLVANNPTAPEMFLRLHYKVVEKEERIKHAKRYISDQGLTMTGLHIARETPTVVTTTTAHDVTVKILNHSNPIAYIVILCRMEDDLKRVGALSSAGISQDTNAPARSDAAGLMRRPDFTRLQDIDAWKIVDGSKQITSTYTREAFSNSCAEGLRRLFPTDIIGSKKIAVISFTEKPTAETHGLGQNSFGGVRDPKIVVSLPAIPTTEPAGARRQLDIFYIERVKNLVMNSQAFRLTNVQS